MTEYSRATREFLSGHYDIEIIRRRVREGSYLPISLVLVEFRPFLYAGNLVTHVDFQEGSQYRIKVVGSDEWVVDPDLNTQACPLSPLELLAMASE